MGFVPRLAEQPERVRGVLRADVASKKLTNYLTGESVSPRPSLPNVTRAGR